MIWKPEWQWMYLNVVKLNACGFNKLFLCMIRIYLSTKPLKFWSERTNKLVLEIDT